MFSKQKDSLGKPCIYIFIHMNCFAVTDDNFQELQELGMPMHSARVELDSAKQAKGISWQTLLICFLIFVTTILIAYSMVQQGRKRKTLHARIWHPPPSESCTTYISPFIHLL